MEEKRESFVFYRSWADILSKQPDAIRLEVYDAIITYACNAEEKELSPLASMAFEFIRRDIDRYYEKCDVIRQKRSDAGKQGGRPKKTIGFDEKQKKQMVFLLPDEKQSISNESKKSLNDNDNYNDNVKEKENIKEKTSNEVEVETTTTTPKQTRFVRPTIEQVQEQVTAKGYHFTAEAFWNYYESNGWKVGKNPMKSWQAAMVTWEKNQKETLKNKTDEEIRRERRRGTEAPDFGTEDYRSGF